MYCILQNLKRKYGFFLKNVRALNVSAKEIAQSHLMVINIFALKTSMSCCSEGKRSFLSPLRGSKERCKICIAAYKLQRVPHLHFCLRCSELLQKKTRQSDGVELRQRLTGQLSILSAPNAVTMRAQSRLDELRRNVFTCDSAGCTLTSGLST